MIVDRPGRAIPTTAWVFEVTNLFTFLGIDANDGEMAASKALAQLSDVVELGAPVRGGIGGESLLIEMERIVHLTEQARDRIGREVNAILLAQGICELGSSASGPLDSSDRIAGGVVVQQKFDQRDDLGGFFSTGGRPPPARRTCPGATC